MKEKIESLNEFKSKIEETYNSQEYRLNSVSKDLVQAINKYDKLIENNILYPGVIGSNNAKFITFHNFIDYVITNISQLLIFRDKTIGMDFKQYKNKLDTMITGLKKQIESIIENNKLFTTSYVDNIEKGLKSHFNLYDQKLFDLKIKNSEQFKDLEKLALNLVNDMEKITKIKREIDISFEKNVENFKYHYFMTEKQLKECLRDYNEMRRRFDLLVKLGWKKLHNWLENIVKKIFLLVLILKALNL